MTLNIANYINGMVRIRIKGIMTERFVNLCMAQRILLWDIVKHDNDLYASMRLNDFFRIRPITRVSQVKIRVVAYRGLPFLIKRVKQRKMMLFGAVASLILLNIMTSYIWFVDIIGTKQLSDTMIREIAVQNGLRPGSEKNTVNAKQIEKKILLAIPEVAWVGVSFSGTRAEIEIVEKTMPREEDKAPTDIVAGKDGVIIEFIALAGKPMVKKGDTVKKGDLLITGIIPEQTVVDEAGQSIKNNVPPQLIKANGIVKARVWYETYGEAEMTVFHHERTGNREMAINIKIGSNQIPLKSAKLDPEAEFENEVIHKKIPVWRNSGLTVESEINIYHEVKTLWAAKTTEEARDEARTKALLAVQNLVPETAQILSRTSEVLDAAEPNLVRVKVSIESIEEIGRSVAILGQ
ncbi:hypothetical protein SDC9_08962 [bioreactor metagenome]|uniref:Sporulation protein YqfD n=1 Tax=bioreactor metagenome TaxID=1076179 RepID=A0A644T8R7_9ZZZZ|nr:sporulation protein YqfD [Negativicutes bacterium]